MFEEDHAPVTLSEIYHQAAYCERTVELGGSRGGVFEQFPSLTAFSDIITTGCGSSHQLAICASFAWSDMFERPVAAIAASKLAIGQLPAYSQAAARDLNPDAPRHLARTVLLNV